MMMIDNASAKRRNKNKNMRGDVRNLVSQKDNLWLFGEGFFNYFELLFDFWMWLQHRKMIFFLSKQYSFLLIIIF